MMRCIKRQRRLCSPAPTKPEFPFYLKNPAEIVTMPLIRLNLPVIEGPLSIEPIHNKRNELFLVMFYASTLSF
jgi:hypothetical protein